MINFSQIKLNKLILHRVGNKYREEGCIQSKEIYPINSELLKELLMKYFLGTFKTNECYRFKHEVNLSFNEVYNYVLAMFQSPEQFIEQSGNILKHLYQQSGHANIKSGELQIAYFNDCIIDDEITDAIGIFKTEVKDNFLQFSEQESNIGVSHSEGVNIKNLDKGCLIINTDEDTGFKVLIVNRSSAETHYWRDEFLNITRISDDSYRTEMYLQMCQNFCKEVMSEESDKKEQITFLNKSVEYFTENERFDTQEFAEKVVQESIQQPQIVERFNEYKREFQAARSLPDTDDFEISKPTLKAAKRKIKNQIKLDEVIEINVKDPSQVNPECFERGYDEVKKMMYYKIFFLQER